MITSFLFLIWVSCNSQALKCFKPAVAVELLIILLFSEWHTASSQSELALDRQIGVMWSKKLNAEHLGTEMNALIENTLLVVFLPVAMGLKYVFITGFLKPQVSFRVPFVCFYLEFWKPSCSFVIYFYMVKKAAYYCSCNVYTPFLKKWMWTKQFLGKSLTCIGYNLWWFRVH